MRPRLRTAFKFGATMLLLVLAVPGPGFGQDTHSAHLLPVLPSDLLERPVLLRAGIGTAHDTVSTKSTQAQAFYDQGLAYLHSYVWIEATRSFNQALRLDPKLALAYVGLSYAYVELNLPAAAHQALERAKALSDDVTGHERRHIEIRALQLAAEDAPTDTATLAACRKALDEALIEFPSDLELWLQRGVAESPDPADRGQGSTAGSVRFYERVLALSPNHFAAHHYLTHAYENIGRIDEALAQGAAYATLVPAVSHGRHMYGHNLRRVGRAEDAIAEFEAADRLGAEYLKRESIPAEHDWHYHHNLDLLATSYQYVGRMRKAEQLLQASFAMPTTLLVQELYKRAWPVFLLSRRRTDEALEATKALIAYPALVVQAMGHVVAGQAELAAGRFATTMGESNAALAALKRVSADAPLVLTSLEALQGEFFLRTGQREKGRRIVEDVVKKVRAAPGPDEWTQALFTLEALARTAREVGEWELASQVAQQMLEHDSAYAGTHYALALVAEHDGDRRTADVQFALAEKAWDKADQDLPELAEIRRKLAFRIR